jgi:Uma2 family endonuclease
MKQPQQARKGRAELRGNPLAAPFAPANPARVKLAGRAKAVPRKLSTTAFEQAGWPEGERWELLNGWAVRATQPELGHQLLCAQVQRALMNWCDEQPEFACVGQMALALAALDCVIQPDVMVLTATDLAAHRRGALRCAPRLVVEVLAPQDAANDLGLKREVLARAGVPEFWALDPATGAVMIFAASTDGALEPLPADNGGFVRSPLLLRRLRVLVDGRRYKLAWM